MLVIKKKSIENRNTENYSILFIGKSQKFEQCLLSHVICNMEQASSLHFGKLSYSFEFGSASNI